MLAFIKRKIRKRRLKRTFKEYGHKIKSFEIAGLGHVEYAQWLHPFEGPKEVNKSQIDFYREFVKDGDFIVDIGAHTGDTTVPMGLSVGKTGLVVGLEPNQYVFKILEVNAKLNPDLTNIEALNFAATKDDGEFTFNYSDASFCNGGYLTQIKNKKHRHNYELKVTGKDFDNYLRENYADWLPKLRLLKVDAEGFDKEILENMSGIISEYRPAIMAECYKKLNNEERTALYQSMASHDYSIYLNDTDYLSDGFVDTAGRIKLTADTMNTRKHFEILAIPN